MLQEYNAREKDFYQFQRILVLLTETLGYL